MSSDCLCQQPRLPGYKRDGNLCTDFVCLDDWPIDCFSCHQLIKKTQQTTNLQTHTTDSIFFSHGEKNPNFYFFGVEGFFFSFFFSLGREVPWGLSGEAEGKQHRLAARAYREQPKRCRFPSVVFVCFGGKNNSDSLSCVCVRDVCALVGWDETVFFSTLSLSSLANFPSISPSLPLLGSLLFLFCCSVCDVCDVGSR